MKVSTLLSTLGITVIVVWLMGVSYGLMIQPKIAYVHSEYLFENYLGTIESYKVLESKTNEWGANLDSLSKSYRATFAKYEFGEDEAKDALGKELKRKEQMFTNYHKAVEKMKADEDQKLTKSVLKQMDAYLKEYAKVNRYDLIIGNSSSSSLVYGEDQLDISEDVLEFINKKYRGE